MWYLSVGAHVTSGCVGEGVVGENVGASEGVCVGWLLEDGVGVSVGAGVVVDVGVELEAGVSVSVGTGVERGVGLAISELAHEICTGNVSGRVASNHPSACECVDE